MARLYKSLKGERAVHERYSELLAHWPVRSQDLTLNTRQGKTFVIVSGPETAPPLVLLHGGAANSAMWIGDIAAWAEHFRVYAVDVIGEAGFSAPVRPPLRSDAYSLWIGDLLQALGIEQASMAGVSLGGWLALDYATRQPDRVHALVLMCPGGVGRQKILVGAPILFFHMFGKWGARKIREMILGRAPDGLPPEMVKLVKLMQVIFENFRARIILMPVVSDAKLKRLTMPVMAILGGKDVLFDSSATKRRLERNVTRTDIRYLPDAGHYVLDQTHTILEFLQASKSATALGG